MITIKLKHMNVSIFKFLDVENIQNREKKFFLLKIAFSLNN